MLRLMTFAITDNVQLNFCTLPTVAMMMVGNGGGGGVGRRTYLPTCVTFAKHIRRRRGVLRGQRMVQSPLVPIGVGGTDRENPVGHDYATATTTKTTRPRG